jgi:hypothetical protein
MAAVRMGDEGDEAMTRIPGDKSRGRFPRWPLAALILVSGLGAIYAFAADRPAKEQEVATAASARLSISAQPSSLTVSPGETATYSVRFRGVRTRRAPTGALGPLLRMRAKHTLPADMDVSLTTASPFSTRATLAVRTTSRTPTGTYRIRVKGRMGPRRARRSVTLVVVPVSGERFSIAGDLGGVLAPGVDAPINLAISNPNPFALSIAALMVTVSGASGPNVDESHSCTPEDFLVTQYSGAYGFTVPASSTRTLAELGIPAGTWPRVLMVNRDVNQDGCKEATLDLTYDGSAVQAGAP